LNISLYFFSRHLLQLLSTRWMNLESAYNLKCFQFSRLSQRYKNCLRWKPQSSAFQSLYHFPPLSKFTNSCASDSSPIGLSPPNLLWKNLYRTSYWIKFGYLTIDLERGIIICKTTHTFYSWSVLLRFQVRINYNKSVISTIFCQWKILKPVHVLLWTHKLDEY
jgi:hypothetical protein